MKKLIMILSLSICGLASYANAISVCKTQAQTYVGAFGGVNVLEIDGFKPGFYAGLSAGYRFSNNIRLEGELAYRRNQLKNFNPCPSVCKYMMDNGHVQNWSGMANLLYDFNFGYSIKPYVGVGLGYTYTEGNYKRTFDIPWILLSTDECKYISNVKTHNISWQAIAGVSYEVCEGTEIALEYRYIDNTKQKYQPKPRNHNFGIAIRQLF